MNDKRKEFAWLLVLAFDLLVCAWALSSQWMVGLAAAPLAIAIFVELAHIEKGG